MSFSNVVYLTDTDGEAKRQEETIPAETEEKRFIFRDNDALYHFVFNLSEIQGRYVCLLLVFFSYL